MPPVAPPGAYSVPTSCEYCGADHTSHCQADCQRPTLFLRKKRPPFSPEPHRWDPVTGYELEKDIGEQEELELDQVEQCKKEDDNVEEEKKEVDVESVLQPATPVAKSESSWMDGFFLGLSPTSAPKVVLS